MPTGPSDPTDEAYEIVKIAGITSCQSTTGSTAVIMSAMLTKPYGPNDNVDLTRAPCYQR